MVLAGVQATESLFRFANWSRAPGRRLLAAISSYTAQAARNCHRVVDVFEPWGIFLTVIGVAIALVAITVELDDRQSERTFRAWQVLLTDRAAAGSSQREAVEYLNRQFDGFLCRSWIGSIAEQLTGDGRRECLFPRKDRESLANIEARDADLTGAEIRASDLRNAKLSNANLSRAQLNRAVLVGADLRGANLTNSNLADANLSRANLLGANLRAADLPRAQLRETNLTCADLWDTDLSHADLRGANLMEAFLMDANLGGANLRGANLMDAILMGATLTDATLTQPQLDAACGEPPRDLPAGLEWPSKPCPPQPAPPAPGAQCPQ